MAEKKARRTYSRAIVRQEGESDVAFLERKLLHAKQVEAESNTRKVARLEKRIASKRAQLVTIEEEIRSLEGDLSLLRAELGIDQPSTPEG